MTTLAKITRWKLNGEYMFELVEDEYFMIRESSHNYNIVLSTKFNNYPYEFIRLRTYSLEAHNIIPIESLFFLDDDLRPKILKWLKYVNQHTEDFLDKWEYDYESSQK